MLLLLAMLYFNSIKVQLRQVIAPLDKLRSLLHFNSIKVQLRQPYEE